MPAAITLGILAGGRGARLGGADKATLAYGGSTLLARTLARFASPGDAARLLSHRASEGPPIADLGDVRVVVDLRAGQPGPLAGLEALLDATRTPWLLTAPVDLRDVPEDLGARLRDGASRACATVVVDADGVQPLVALWPVVPTLAVVRAALDAARPAVRAMLGELPHVHLDIRPWRLGNLNTARDFAA